MHSAGIFWPNPLAEAPLEDFDMQWRVNVRAPYALTQAALPHLKRDTRRLDYAGGWAGVEIEDHHRWLMHFRRSREQRMKLERGEV